MMQKKYILLDVIFRKILNKFLLVINFWEIFWLKYIYSPPKIKNGNILFSIIVPVYNTKKDHFFQMIKSVENQNYKNWELILYNDNSPNIGDIEFYKKKTSDNPKIKWYESNKNQGISLATKNAIKHATGDYLIFLDHDDRLMKFALYQFYSRVSDKTKRPDFLYSDEIYLFPNPLIRLISRKPSFDLLKIISHNYICHLVCISKNLYIKMGGYRSGFDGSQDHEFILRATRFAKRVEHIPKPLYEWRIHSGSFSNTKAEICKKSSIKAIREHLNFYGLKNISIENGIKEFTYHYKISNDVIINLLPIIRLEISSNLSNIIERFKTISSKTLKIFDIIILTNEGYKIYNLKNESSRKISISEILKITKKNSTNAILFYRDFLNLFEEKQIRELYGTLYFNKISAVSPIILNSNKRILFGGYLVGKNGFIGKLNFSEGFPLKNFYGLYTNTEKLTSIFLGDFVLMNINEISSTLLQSYQSNPLWNIECSIKFNIANKLIAINPYSQLIQDTSSFNEIGKIDLISKETTQAARKLFRLYPNFFINDKYYPQDLNYIGLSYLPKIPFHGYFRKKALKNFINKINLSKL